LSGQKYISNKGSNHIDYEQAQHKSW
jgi:hypothetical protein